MVDFVFKGYLVGVFGGGGDGRGVPKNIVDVVFGNGLIKTVGIVGIEGVEKFTIRLFVLIVPAVKITVGDALGETKPNKTRALVSPGVIAPAGRFVKR